MELDEALALLNKKPTTATVDEGQRQMILLALALLSLGRPGWHAALGDVAAVEFGRDLYEEFRTIHQGGLDAGRNYHR